MIDCVFVQFVLYNGDVKWFKHSKICYRNGLVKRMQSEHNVGDPHVVCRTRMCNLRNFHRKKCSGSISAVISPSFCMLLQKNVEVI